jgi:hypothetical protein
VDRNELARVKVHFGLLAPIWSYDSFGLLIFGLLLYFGLLIHSACWKMFFRMGPRKAEKKWAENLYSRALVSVHLLWIRPILRCNRLVKKGLQSLWWKFLVFDKNPEFCMNLIFSDIFRNIGRISRFRPFKIFGHLIIRPDFFRPHFHRPFVFRPLASLPFFRHIFFSANQNKLSVTEVKRSFHLSTHWQWEKKTNP